MAQEIKSAAALESALLWEKLAEDQDKWAEYELGRGQSPCGYRHRARTYRETAKALRLEAQTGVAHCACLKPVGTCRTR